MSETAKNARTNKTANDTDDSKSLYELAMSCTGEYGAFLLMMPLLMLLISWLKWLLL
jgi:hypothetical protein